jgi:prepilin-type processing-associated H-X9-DG protein
MLTVIAVIAILAGLLLPVLSSARERARRIGCASNLRQIGMAIMAFAGDHDNHTPPVIDTSVTPNVPWYTALINGNYATRQIFQCPSDRRAPVLGTPPAYLDRITPLSYAIVVGKLNYTPNDYWIAGSRLTCPYLTNSATVIVGELYLSGAVAQTLEKGVDGAGAAGFITSPSDLASSPHYPPTSPHEKGAPLKGNYLFLDGHVEWVEAFMTGGVNDPAVMFPQVPPSPAPFVPCP